jgi:peptidyl-prolyl cis-trans isomerase C
MVCALQRILVESEQACEQLKTEIAGGKEFTDLAQQHSKCPSGKQGGDLGSFRPGQMVPEFDRVVFSAPLNEVQGPVKTQFGWHLIEITSRDG